MDGRNDAFTLRPAGNGAGGAKVGRLAGRREDGGHSDGRGSSRRGGGGGGSGAF